MIKGSQVRIGDASEVNVWNAPWLPCPINGRVSSDRREELPYFMVSDLIVSEQKRWDGDKIHSIFNELDVSLILSIPLSVRHVKDDWRWLGDKNEAYTVKTGY